MFCTSLSKHDEQFVRKSVVKQAKVIELKLIHVMKWILVFICYSSGTFTIKPYFTTMRWSNIISKFDRTTFNDHPSKSDESI